VGWDFSPALWNRAEQAEKRKDSRLAQEIQISLPHKMTAQQRQWLVTDFVREQFTRKGITADVAIHAPSPCCAVQSRTLPRPPVGFGYEASHALRPQPSTGYRAQANAAISRPAAWFPAEAQGTLVNHHGISADHLAGIRRALFQSGPVS
jgi:ATP-dependent exoDNAse (exonuclease V) alpha subunit